MTMNRIRQSFICLMILTLAVCLGTVALHAQTSTEGAIAGTVLDPTGAVVPGAAVTIHNMGTNAEIKLTSDASGFFKAPLLEPGTYRVTFAALGFATYHANNVIVQVGQPTDVSPRLTVGASSTSIEVTEQAPVLNLESPDFQGTLNMNALQSIPINNRRWSALALTTPGVTVDSYGYGLISVRGISTLLNNVEIDGADDNQAFFAEERGRTREAYSTAGSAVREFAINTGVYSAEYGRAAGGVVTSVTKSGTNQLHGQAYFWDRESKWAAMNDYAFVTTLVSGVNVRSHIKPKDLRKIYGFTVGGALIKDKLFWIYTYDQHTHVFPVLGVPYDPQQFYTLPQTALTTGETCNTTTGELVGAPSTAINDTNACALAARQGISYAQASYDWAAMLYGNANVTVGSYTGAAPITDLGLGSSSELGLSPRFGYQEINTPKLDWQITPKEHLSVLYHRLRWDSPSGVQTANPVNYAMDTMGNDFVKLDYGVIKLTSLISNNLSNELLYQYSRELNYETQQALTPYSKADITASNGNVPELEAGDNYGFNAGSTYYEHRTAYPDERKWQVGDVLYWGKGSHSLKFGVDMVHNFDLMNNTYHSNGDFTYLWVGNYFNDLLNMKHGVTPSSSNPKGCDSNGSQNWDDNSANVTDVYPCYDGFSQGFGNPVYTISTMDTGVFAQDNWKATPRLTLELGLRWDHETIPPADPNLTTATGTFVTYNGIANSPSSKMNFGPRIGFSYDITGKGKTVVRGGWGMYYGRVNNGNIENVRLNTGSPHGQFNATWNSDTTAAPVYPNIFASGSASGQPTSYFMAPNLKLPEVQEYDLQVQQALGKGTFLSVSYLGALGRDLPNFLDVNLNPTTTTKTITIAGDPNGKGPLGATGTTVTVPVYTGYGNTALLGSGASSFRGISELISNVNSNYNAMVLEILNRSSKSLQFDVNYTWSHALDFAQSANTQGVAEAWYDPYVNPRINYGNSTWNIPNRVAAYALYNFPNVKSTGWVKYLVNDWSLNDSFQMQNGLPFTAGTSYKPGGAISYGWNGSGGPTIIPKIGYDTYRYPRRIVDDARFQKQISFNKGRNLQLMCNVFNVANHQNITAFSTTYLYYESGTTATYTGVDGTGSKNFMVPSNSNSSNFTYTPRNIEFTARINF